MTGRRYIDLFNRLNYFSEMSSLLPYTNVQFYPFQSVVRVYNQPRMNVNYRVACLSSNSGANGRMPAWLMHLQQVLAGAEPPVVKANEPTPKVTLEHVRVHFSRSGGPGGQNVNKVNTKVDMRFNVMAAGWLPLGVRERISQMEKNRINTDGELFISSTKTRSQKGNIDDALGKLQAIIDAAADVPPSQADQKIKKIEKLAEIIEKKGLKTKIMHSLKKAGKRKKGS